MYQEIRDVLGGPVVSIPVGAGLSSYRREPSLSLSLSLSFLSAASLSLSLSRIPLTFQPLKFFQIVDRKFPKRIRRRSVSLSFLRFFRLFFFSLSIYLSISLVFASFDKDDLIQLEVNVIFFLPPFSFHLTV